MARSLRDRLMYQLEGTRNELIETVSPISDSDLEWAPEPSMKTYRSQLLEIGAMEAESSILLRTGSAPTWHEAEAHVRGSTTSELLHSLKMIRAETLEWLRQSDDDYLREAVPIPEPWWPYMGDQELEREELVRWINQHEYYHLGQIISYRWIQGHNPYRPAG